jgi:flagellar M-ring protein FliF
MQIRQILSKLTPRNWAMLGGAGLIVIVFFYVLMSLASAPSYTILQAGINPSQTGQITSTLASKGIAYEIQNGGTAIAVQPSQVAQARIALAGAGLLGSQQPGMSLFNNQSLGQSNFQQQITYQRALEGQLANTIQTIQGISSAQVQLVLPDPQSELFAANSTPSSAAVLVTDTGSLDPSSVKGIAQMVASSVPSLTAEKVTITDQTGALLWPTSSSGTTGLLSKQQAESRYDSTEAAAVDALLATTLGPGKAEVQINADLNTNQTSLNSLTYAKKGVALQSHKETETLKGPGSASGGLAGTTAGATGGAATPAYAASGTSGASNYKHVISDNTYGIDKTITRSDISPGAINHQSVSVLIDKSVPAAEIPSLKSAVAAAVGLSAKRGDTLAFGQIAFAKQKPIATPSSSSPMSMLKYAKTGAIALGAIVFLFFMRRLLRRRESEALAGQPTWLRELEAPRSLATFETGELDEPTRVMQLRPPVNVARQQIEDLVERDPDRVAQQVRAWMAED